MRRQMLFLVVTIITIVTCTNRALGVTDTNALLSGDWGDSNTWSAGVPVWVDGGTQSDAQIEQGFNVTIDDDTAEAFRIIVGDNDQGNSGTLTMTGGTLSTDKVFTLGGFEVADNNGTGTLNQSGGQILIGALGTNGGSQQFVVGDAANTKGYYNLSGTGTLNAPDGVAIANALSTVGQIHQTGGAITAPLMDLGKNGSGTYLLESGSLELTGALLVATYVDGSGSITQSGGTITMSNLDVGRNGIGSYALQGGSVTSSATGAGIELGRFGTSSGTVIQSGGSLATLNEDLTIAEKGNAQYTMTGGTIDVADDLFIGRASDGGNSGLLDQSSGTVTVTNNVWVSNINQSIGTYSFSADAIAIFGGSLNVCSALAANNTTPDGASGTLNIVGEDVSITVGGDLNASGAGANALNSSLINFTTGVTGNVSTIDVAGAADIDGAVIDIIESSPVAIGTVLDLVETEGGVSNLGSASVGPAASGSWTLRLGGASDNILQAVKVPEPSSIVLVAIGAAVACFFRKRRSL